MTAKKLTQCAQRFSESKQQNTFLCTLKQPAHQFAWEISIKTIDFNARDVDVSFKMSLLLIQNFSTLLW